MKFLLPLFLLAATAFAGPVELLKDGSLSIDGTRLILSVFTRDWRCLQAGNDPDTFQELERSDADGVETVRCRVRFPGASPGELTVSVKRNSDGSADCSYRVTLENPSPVNFLCLQTALPISLFGGAGLEADCKKLTLPVEYGATLIPGTGKVVTEFQFPAANGPVTLRGDFYLHIQDNRAWNGSTYGLRLGFLPHTSLSGEWREAKLEFRVTQKLIPCRPIDLCSAANTGFTDEADNDVKGGWTDQGKANDLRNLPAGTRRMQGIVYDILDPAKNGGRSCIVLRGRARPRFASEAVAPQSGGPSGNFLYLLHAIAYAQSGEPVGKVTVEYADGTSTVCEVRSGRDAGDWWRPRACPNGTIAWTGANPSGAVGLFSSAFPIGNRPVKAFRFTSAGNAVWGIVAATLSDAKSESHVLPPYYAAPGKEWQPVHYQRDVKPGSALDFSNLLDAPAGKYGPLTIGKKGKFVFRDRPEMPVRFFGTNFVGGAQFLDKEWAEKLADRIARLGFNTVRIHHHDNELCSRGDTTVPDPEQFDRLDCLLACMKKRGIYYTTDVYVSRRMLTAAELPGLGRIETPAEFKALFWIDDVVYANWEKWARAFLCHVNPYTGTALKDDPALISLSLVNEGNPEKWWNATPRSADRWQQAFDRWLGREKLSPKDRNDRAIHFRNFLASCADARYRRMKAFIRGLGCTVPLTDQNFVSTVRLSAERTVYDFVDNHAYWDHPRFAETRWQLPILPSQANPLQRAQSVPGILMPTRIYGKPFTVSEFDYANPNRFRAVGPAFMAAYAAFQDWDGLWQFAYGHSSRIVKNEDTYYGFFDIAADLTKTFAERIAARLFLAGGVEPASRNFAVAIGDAGRLPADADYPDSVSELGFVAGIGTTVFGRGPVDRAKLPKDVLALIDVGDLPAHDGGLPVFAAGTNLIPELIAKKLLPASCYDAATRTLNSPSGQLSLGLKEGTLRVAARGAEVLAVPQGKSLAGNRLRVRNRVADALFAALPLDTADFSTARRVVLMHLTNTQATDMKFSNASLDRLESWGKPPFLVRRGEADATLRLEGGGWKLYALDTAGERVEELPLETTADGTLSFQLNTFRKPGPVCAYELVRQEAQNGTD